MKQPEYTAGVTAVYRKYLDLLEKNGKESYHVEEKDRRNERCSRQEKAQDSEKENCK